MTIAFLTLVGVTRCLTREELSQLKELIESVVRLLRGGSAPTVVNLISESKRDTTGGQVMVATNKGPPSASTSMPVII